MSMLTILCLTTLAFVVIWFIEQYRNERSRDRHHDD
jgi:hypothetical protein